MCNLIPQISTNGLISFEEGFFAPGVRNVLPFSLLDSFNHVIIAPLWVDFHSSPDGFIFSRISNNPDDLEAVKIVFIANANPDFCGFEPTQVIIVTWFRLILNVQEVKKKHHPVWNPLLVLTNVV